MANPGVLVGARGPRTLGDFESYEQPVPTVPGRIKPTEVIFLSRYPQLQMNLGEIPGRIEFDARNRRVKPRIWVRFAESSGGVGGYLRLDTADEEEALKVERLRKHKKYGIDFFEPSVVADQNRKRKIAKRLAEVDSDPELRSALEAKLGQKAMPLPERNGDSDVPQEPAKARRRKKAAEAEEPSEGE